MIQHRSFQIVGCSVLILLAASTMSNAQMQQHAQLSLQVQQKDAGLIFWVFGDWGSGGKAQKKVAAAMGQKIDESGGDAVFALGDNFLGSGVRDVNDSQWNRKFENMYPAGQFDLPFWAVLGNHDYMGNPDAQVAYTGRTLKDGSTTRWNMPGRHWSTVFSSADGSVSVHVVGLDSQPVVSSRSGRKAELLWLDSVLAASSEPWIFVLGHHPVYSHGHYGDNKTMKKHLEPLFEKYGVDCYFNGHDHDLQLLKPGKRTMYVISGAGSQTRKTKMGRNSLFASSSLGFVRCDLRSDEIGFQFLDAKGKVLFEKSFQKAVLKRSDR